MALVLVLAVETVVHVSGSNFFD